MLTRPWWTWAGGAVVVAGTASLVLGVVRGESAWNLVSVPFMVSFWVVGHLEVVRDGQRGNAGLMVAAAAALAVSNLAWEVPAVGPVFGRAVSFLPMVLLGLLLLRWPSDRLTGTAARAWMVAAVLAQPLSAAGALTYDPARHGEVIDSWWPAWGGPAVEDLVSVAEESMASGLLLALGALVIARLVRASPAERRELVPVAAVVAVAAVAGVPVTLVPLVLGLPGSAWSQAAVGLVVATFPAAVLVSRLSQRLRRAFAVEELLLDPDHLPDAAAVRAVLARALDDPQLALALWSPGQGGFAAPALGPQGARARPAAELDVADVDGGPLARVTLDVRLAARPDLVEAVLRAASRALEAVRLRAEAAAHVEDRARLARLLPGGVADRVLGDPAGLGSSERLLVTVLMSDVRGYSAIAETTDAADLALQVDEHRRAVNAVVLAEGGTVVQYVGDAVMAVFGAPEPLDDHAARALRAALAVHRAQSSLDAEWAGRGLPAFGLGIGLSTGEVAAAVLGSAERAEYTLVGDVVNLAARLCDAARPAGSTVASAATVAAAGLAAGVDAGLDEVGGHAGPGAGLGARVRCGVAERLVVKGRAATVLAHRVEAVPADDAGAPTTSVR